MAGQHLPKQVLRLRTRGKVWRCDFQTIVLVDADNQHPLGAALLRDLAVSNLQPHDHPLR